MKFCGDIGALLERIEQKDYPKIVSVFLHTHFLPFFKIHYTLFQLCMLFFNLNNIFMLSWFNWLVNCLRNAVCLFVSLLCYLSVYLLSLSVCLFIIQAKFNEEVLSVFTSTMRKLKSNGVPYRIVCGTRMDYLLERDEVFPWVEEQEVVGGAVVVSGGRPGGCGGRDAQSTSSDVPSAVCIRYSTLQCLQ